MYVSCQPYARLWPTLCARRSTELRHMQRLGKNYTFTLGNPCFGWTISERTICMCRVGQNHIYTVCIRYFWQGNHHIYGHIRCIYTVLANPMYVAQAYPACIPIHCSLHPTQLGLARTVYIRCISGNFGREFTKHTLIYGVFTLFWPTLHTTKAQHVCTACMCRPVQLALTQHNTTQATQHNTTYLR